MSNTESRYDFIIIGTGASGQAAVKALKEKGKNAYLIDLKPETVLTLVSQSFRQEDHAKDPSSDRTRMNGLETTILLHKHTVQTPTGESVTYTFHPDLANATEQLREYEHTQPVDVEAKVTEHESQSNSPEEETEVLEAQQVEYSHPFPFYEKSPFLDKINQQQAKMSFKESTEATGETEHYSLYHLERIELEDEDGDMNGESAWAPPSTQLEPTPLATPPFHSQPAYLEERAKQEAPPKNPGEFFDAKQEPIYREREVKLRKRLASNLRKEAKKAKESSSAYQESPENQIQFENLPFRDLSSMYKDAYPEQKAEKNEKEGDSFTLESFTSRRRTRSHKKTRLQPKIEPLAKKRKSMFKKPPAIIWDETPSAPEPNAPYSPFGPSQTEAEYEEPTHSQSADGFMSREPFQKETQPENEGSLKRDDIEFEDAYGGYNSWEEFLTPFSQNSRKRQEMDKVEKRKIALRGLHNLINNLG